MTRAIDRDWRHFRKVIDGRLRKELKKFFSTGKFVTKRAKNGKMAWTLPRIELPHIVYGEGNGGIGRGPGQKGDVIGRDPKKGDDGGPGQEEADGITVNVDLTDVLMFAKDELQLPDMKPKPNDTFKDVKIRYNNISLTGPESLRHNRRTMLRAMQRLACTGEADKLHLLPGYSEPVRLITPINSDKRYRQYQEFWEPSSNAVIMFGRDGSNSVDQYRCEIISDICWWIDAWIRQFYENVERCYFWHDVNAKEVDEDTFYKYRYGGGTNCSSCLKLMAKQFESRFQPSKWNIYCFYFGDGDNVTDDNPVFAQTLKESFPPEVCNLFGFTQVVCWNYNNSLKKYLDGNLEKLPNFRSTSVGKEDSPNRFGTWTAPTMSDDERNEAVKRAIRYMLGAKAKN